MIRRDGRLDGARLRHRGREEPAPLRLRQQSTGAAQQLTGGLGGERQPEDLIGQGISLGNQPQDTGRHDRCFARTRTGDDRRRLRGAADRGPLLIAELMAENILDDLAGAG